MTHYTIHHTLHYCTLTTHSLHTHLWVLTSMPAGNCAMPRYRLHFTPYTLHLHCTLSLGNDFDTSRKLTISHYRIKFPPYTLHYSTLTTHYTTHYLWVNISLRAGNYTITHYTEYSLHVYQTLYTPAHSLHTHYTAHYRWVITSMPAENCTITHYRMHSTLYTLHYCTPTTHYTTLHIICGGNTIQQEIMQ